MHTYCLVHTLNRAAGEGADIHVEWRSVANQLTADMTFTFLYIVYSR